MLDVIVNGLFAEFHPGFFFARVENYSFVCINVVL